MGDGGSRNVVGEVGDGIQQCGRKRRDQACGTGGGGESCRSRYVERRGEDGSPPLEGRGRRGQACGKKRMPIERCISI